MKILYGVQGTGNGHIGRAREIMPHLLKYADVDVAISGTQSDIDLGVPTKYHYQGVSFVFGKRGDIDIWRTATQVNPTKLWKDILSVPLEDYDLIVSDFEPITTWAAFQGKTRGVSVPTVGVSHQASFIAPGTPVAPTKTGLDLFAKVLFHQFAPCDYHIGFHYQRYHPSIQTPIVRQDIRAGDIADDGHYTVYLPAFEGKYIAKQLSQISKAHWQVFDKHCKKAFTVDNVQVQPVSHADYLQSLLKCRGLLTAAGFQSTSEALHMGKQLMVIPMNDQYEQRCNEVALKGLGIHTARDLHGPSITAIEDWIANPPHPIRMDYPDNAADVAGQIISYAQPGHYPLPHQGH